MTTAYNPQVITQVKLLQDLNRIHLIPPKECYDFLLYPELAKL